MSIASDGLERLQDVKGIRVASNVLLSTLTRFGIGGPAAMLCEIEKVSSFVELLRTVKAANVPHVVIGEGTNLIAADSGFDGIVLRFTGSQLRTDGSSVHAESGASLQAVVDLSMEAGLAGMETMTGIPGSLGAAIYGNAGAYGHSIQERVDRVLFTDGQDVRTFANADCEFDYRESIFKNRKDWVILSADLSFSRGEPATLKDHANEIRTIRDTKYPPTMKCAGSIFKNCLFRNLPSHVQAQVPAGMVREGKVPSAWFLEQVGAKGMRRGDIQIADYHANLIYNDGKGTARDLVYLIANLKARVKETFGFEIEEEVQYLGFDGIH
jgi:UDP-N-acetylmuramate dehydrogenase